MNNPSVILQDLTIGYAVKQHQKVVAQGINAAIRQGEFTCLLGANGIGKSTLLRTLSAFQPPLSGQILLEGKSLHRYTDRHLSRKVGVVLTE